MGSNIERIDGLFELCVSDHLLDEVEANVAQVMRTAQYNSLAQKLNGPDVDDLYHIAAAIEAGADFIVTNNTRDFITTRLPDGTETPETVQRISDKYKNPRLTPLQILDGLEKIGLKKTIEHLRNYNSASVLDS